MNPFPIALRWYKKHGRDLPWRKTRDPYKILISEIMLQQTQVDRVIVYYQNWLKTFPNWKTLASAKRSDVIKAWSGLGYNRRALFLKSAAEQVVRNGIPETESGWRELKGVGEYTAAAVAAFSLKERTLPIDTNIRRILGRVLLGKTFPDADDDARIKKAAMKLYPARGAHYDIPQALFDIASLYCVKKPDCANCPLRASCKAAPKFLSGRVRIPKRSVKIGNEKIRPGKKYPDRIYRGRILKLVNESSSVSIKNIGHRIDPGFNAEDEAWVSAMIDRLQKDGLIERRGETIRLPTA